MAVQYRAIGIRIRELRKKKGLTQQQMAERLHLSDVHYGRIERGERYICLEQLESIARELEASVTELLAGAFPDETQRTVCRAGEDRYVEGVTALMKGMNREKRRLIFDVCYLMAGDYCIK